MTDRGLHLYTGLNRQGRNRFAQLPIEQQFADTDHDDFDHGADQHENDWGHGHGHENEEGNAADDWHEHLRRRGSCDRRR